MAITLTITQSVANITGYTVGQPYAFLLEYSGPTGSDSIRSPSSGYATITTATYTINISSVTTAYVRFIPTRLRLAHSPAHSGAHGRYMGPYIKQ